METAEALAELHHKNMREELGIAADDSPRINDLFHQKYRGLALFVRISGVSEPGRPDQNFCVTPSEENIGVSA